MVVATVQISETNGAGATVTNNISNINMGSVDTPNLVAANNPVNAGTNAFEKWVRYYLSAKNDSNKIDNFQVWMTPSTAETGITYKTNLSTTLQNDSYPGSGPTTSTSTVADLAMPTSDPGATNIGVSAGTGGLSTNGTYSDYIVFQLQVGSGAAPGNLLQKTFNFQYDEQ